MNIRKCPCCNSVNLKKKYTGMVDLSYFVPGSFDMIKCNQCKFEFTIPILTEKELGKYYPSDKYYSFQEYSWLAKTYHKISAAYYAPKRKRYLSLLKPFSSLLYTYHLVPGASVLEIGCGSGLKLEIYQEYNVNTKGIEPYGAPLTPKEKKLGISRESIQKASFKENSFDIIILKEVLEHMPDQHTVLKKCNKWLKPHGKLVITVQNTKSVWRSIFGRYWVGYDVPRHVYNYDSENIIPFLNNFEFKVNSVREYDNPYMFTGSLRYKIVAKSNKRLGDFFDKNIFKVMLTPLSLLISLIGGGSLMEIECTKLPKNKK